MAKKKIKNNTRKPKTKTLVTQGMKTKFIPDSAKGKKLVLHMGCEKPQRGDDLDERFSGKEWHEVRLSFNKNIKADVTAKIGDLSLFEDQQFDAIWFPNKIDRLFAYEVDGFLKECHRILKYDGCILLTTPNIKEAARKIYKEGIDQVLYKTNSGYEITPMDIVFGFGEDIKSGKEDIVHNSGFTPVYLLKRVKEYFRDSKVQASGFQTWAMAYKRKHDTDENTRGKLIGDDMNQRMVERDNIDKEPEQPVIY